MDNGLSGDFFDILNTTELNSYVVTSGIVRGRNYRFRYRVANVNGWSAYSMIGYITAFSQPSIPPPP